MGRVVEQIVRHGAGDVVFYFPVKLAVIVIDASRMDIGIVDADLSGLLDVLTVITEAYLVVIHEIDKRYRGSCPAPCIRPGRGLC